MVSLHVSSLKTSRDSRLQNLEKLRIKGENPLQNWINFKRKSTFFSTEQWKNDENWMRNKEDMTFWNFKFFRKTLLDQSLWIFKWASWWWFIPSQIFHVYIWNFEKFSVLAHTGKNISPYQNVSRVNIISHLLWVVIRQVLYSHSWNIRFLSFLYMKWIENCEGMTSSTRSFEYS